MSTFCHPAFPDITHTVPDDQDADAIAKGWLTAEESGYQELAADPEPRIQRRTRRGRSA